MNIGVIGFGNLGRAFVSGLIQYGGVLPSSVYVCAKSEETLLYAKEHFNVNNCKDVNSMIPLVDVIVLLVKPTIYNDIATSIDTELIKGKLIVSFMAGITVDNIKSALASDCVMRAMPNLAIQNGCGVIAVSTDDINHNNYNNVLSILSKLGTIFEVNEDDIEKITALSACGLGFAAYIINSFIKSGVSLGLDKRTSEAIVNQTFIGATKSGDCEKLIKSVATKGGATEKGLHVLQQGEIDNVISESIKAALMQVESFKLFAKE